MNLDDTIVAIATPPGRGGIGVVRLAGPEAQSIAMPMLRLKHDLEPGRAVFGELVEPDSCGAGALVRENPGAGTGAAPTPDQVGADTLVCSGQTSVKNPRIDEVVVSFFQKPHSYTTDDIVEISAHGSPVVLRHIIELAQTLYQAKIAAQQLEGSLSRRLQPIKQKLVELIALLEAGIDFAEDDISVLLDATILERIAAVRTPLEELAGSFAYGKIVHEGLTLAIVGLPNVGKSSLFNRLVERERAIVTATPGTTRDLISETVAIGGIPVKLVDTAGIRRALDEAESIGIRKSMEALADADIVLVVLDCSQPLAAEDEELLEQVQGRAVIMVENKCDLVGASGHSWPPVVNTDLQEQVNSGLKRHGDSDLEGHGFRRASSSSSGRGPLAPEAHVEAPRIRTSALTGEGIPQLRAEILRHIGGEVGTHAESGFLTSVRHQSLVRDSLAALEASKTAVRSKVPHEMLLLDLYNALRPLDEITGATTTDDILNLIFSTFCIGK